MVDPEQAQLILGVIGNITSFGILAYHVPRYIKVVNDRSVGNMQPDFPVVHLLYSAICFMYGLHDDTILLRIVHAQGFVFHGVCLIFYLLNCEATKSGKIYIKVCLFAVAEIIAMLAVILITCMICKSLDSKLKFLGVTCVIFHIMMLVFHVASIAKVVENVELMHFSLELLGFINSIVWMAYSLIYKIDIYLFICSAIGAFLSASEIVIYALYRHKGKTCKVKSA